MRGGNRGCFVAGDGNYNLVLECLEKISLKLRSSLLLFRTSVVCRIISGAG